MTNATNGHSAFVTDALVGMVLRQGFGGLPKLQVLESESAAITKQEIEQIVRKVLKHDLEDSVLAVLKKELKSQSFEDVVTGVTSRALAKFFEIMFTRKSTWQSQLRK